MIPTDELERIYQEAEDAAERLADEFRKAEREADIAYRDLIRRRIQEDVEHEAR